MAITIKDCETFGWTTDPNKLIARWSATGLITALSAPGPYGSGNYARLANGGYLNTLAWMKSGKLLVEFSINVAAFANTDVVRYKVDAVNTAFNLGVSGGGQMYFSDVHNGQVFFPANMVVGNWYRVQCTLVCGNPGTVYIWVNGNDITGGGYSTNLRYFGDYSPVTFFQFLYQNAADTLLSNLVWGFVDNAATDKFPADQRAACVKPSANSAVVWTPNGAGTNVACLTQAAEPDDDTTYNSSNVTGDQDLFSIVPPGLTGTINFASLKAIARKDDAGAQFLQPSIKGANLQQGTSTGLGSNYQAIPYSTWPAQNNPSTGIPYTGPEVDALKIGYRNNS